MKIFILVGLPCSGKSFLGQLIAEKENAIFLDDISTRKDPLKELRESIGKNIVISDVFLCREKDRENAIEIINGLGKYDLEWIFFENNRYKCLNNLRYRNAKGDVRKVENLIREMTKVYKIPDGVAVREIWQDKFSGIV